MKMNEDYDLLPRVESLASSSVSEFRARNLGELVTDYKAICSRHEAGNFDKTNLNDYLEDLNSSYSEMLDIDMIEANELEEKIILADVDNSSYSAFRDMVKIPDNIEGDNLFYKELSSEIFHLYQFRESETWSHPLFREGLERAVSTKEISNNDREEWQNLYIELQTYVVADGFATLKELESGCQIEDLEKIGLTNQESQEIIDNVCDFSSMEYNLGASIALALERDIGENIYGDIFRTNYPHEEEIEQLSMQTDMMNKAKCKICNVWQGLIS